MAESERRMSEGGTLAGELTANSDRARTLRPADGHSRAEEAGTAVGAGTTAHAAAPAPMAWLCQCSVVRPAFPWADDLPQAASRRRRRAAKAIPAAASGSNTTNGASGITGGGATPGVTLTMAGAEVEPLS